MKLKLFNGVLTSLSLGIVAGGYDPETARVTVVVRGEPDNTAGVLLLDVTEANKLISILSVNLPKVERIVAEER